MHITIIEYNGCVQSVVREFKAGVFQAMAHPTRIAILEELRNGELSANALQARLGIEQANLSQHLALLRNKRLVVNRKAGNQVFYSVRDHVLIEVLDIMRRYLQSHVAEIVEMLGDSGTETAKK